MRWIFLLPILLLLRLPCADSVPASAEVSTPALSSPVEKPVLYYFSSPSCPACAMMGPVLKHASESLGSRLEIREFKHRSTERDSLIRKYSRQIDMNYVPTWILSDSSGRVFTHGKGFVPSSDFLEDLNSGLEKRSRLNDMKVHHLIFVCETGGPACDSSEKAVDEWALDQKELKVEKVNVAVFKTEDEWKNFFARVNGFRYMKGMEYIPALIALSEHNEVVELLQKGFSRTEIESRLKGLY